MKVFHISGRDHGPYDNVGSRPRASMKVFHISGRDLPTWFCRHQHHPSLNESLPHKRKRPTVRGRPQSHHRRLNESLPHKRKRLCAYHARHRFLHARLNESLPHKRKRRLVVQERRGGLTASMKVFHISGRDRPQWNGCDKH